MEDSCRLTVPNRADGSNNFYSPGVNIDTFDSELGRVDFNISNRDSLFGRYIYFNSDLQKPGIAPLYGQLLPLAGQNFAVQETHLFTPTFLNVFKFGLNHDNIFLSLAAHPH